MAQYKILGPAANGPSLNAGYRIIGLAPQKTEPQEIPQPVNQEGLSSIPGDIADAGMNLFMSAGNKAIQLPDELTEAGQQLIAHPLATPPRAARGILGGLLEGGKQLYNLPLNLGTYLGEKGIPVFKQTAPLAEKLKIGETGLQKAVMGEGKPGDELWKDIGLAGSMLAAPEAAGLRVPAVTSKGIVKQLSKQKAKELSVAKKDYSSLFTQAKESGLSHAPVPNTAIKNMSGIIKNSQSKFHNSFKKYLSDPTIENAHWAQSELGALERHLDSISKKTGLTPSQIKTQKAVTDTKNAIKESMFSNNAFGKNPALGLKYQQLANRYRENVIP